MHGRNGRVDRFPSLGSLSLVPHQAARSGVRSGGSIREVVENRGSNGDRGGRRTGALHGALCNVERARSPPLSLSLSLAWGFYQV